MPDVRWTDIGGQVLVCPFLRGDALYLSTRVCYAGTNLPIFAVQCPLRICLFAISSTDQLIFATRCPVLIYPFFSVRRLVLRSATPLLCYASATRCPVLRLGMLLPARGERGAKRGSRVAVEVPRSVNSTAKSNTTSRIPGTKGGGKALIWECTDLRRGVLACGTTRLCVGDIRSRSVKQVCTRAALTWGYL